MPTINVLFNDLQRLVGRRLPRDTLELNDILSYVKGEVESLLADELAIEIKDGNRPDLWCVEGIARALRGGLDMEEGLIDYHVAGQSGVEIQVDPGLKDVRPYIGCAVVRGLELDDEIIRELVHLQDKLDQTYGRRRSRASIGFYNLDMIRPPIRYAAVKPGDVSFVPLDSERTMTLDEILSKHPKGIEYGYILRVFERWPILLDSNDSVLSFPPIVNSNDLGRITEDLKNVFVEVTGTSYDTVRNTLTLVSLSLADRGKEIFTTKVNYPTREPDITPQLENKHIGISQEYVERTLGVKLSQGEMKRLLMRARFGVSTGEEGILDVTIPCYRVDVMHPVDVIEDIGVMYGYNRMEIEWPKAITFGKSSEKEEFSDTVRELMVGLGCQELVNFTLDSEQNQLNRMNLEAEVVKISNPKTLRYTCLRRWLMPSLLDFLSCNTHFGYPQKIFEVGDCVVPYLDENRIVERRQVACIVIHSKANFSEGKSLVEALMMNLGLTCKLMPIEHTAFITGRAGAVLVNGTSIGVVGEISPEILLNWNLENPAAAFELDLGEISLCKED